WSSDVCSSDLIHQQDICIPQYPIIGSTGFKGFRRIIQNTQAIVCPFPDVTYGLGCIRPLPSVHFRRIIVWLVRGNGYQKARITFAVYRFFLLKRPIQSGGRFIVFVPPETVARWRISNGQTGELSPVCIRLSRPVSVGSSFGRKLYLK